MEDDEFNIPISPPSLKQKLKNSLCFSCCFGHRSHRSTTTQLQTLGYHPPKQSDENPSLIWIKTTTTTTNSDLPHDIIKDKCRTIFNFIGHGNNRHKRHSSTEFRYDPLSYSLNFEDGYNEDDEAPFRNFSSRLPPPPPLPPTTTTVKAVSVSAGSL